MARFKEVKEEEVDQIDALLQDERFKGTHFNDVEPVDWTVSTGSLALDYALSTDGRMGIGPQVFNIFADFGQGKSSFLYSMGARFQKQADNNFFVLINAEGRSNDELVRRTGIDTSKEKYRRIDSNVAETVFGIIRELCQKNPKNRRYWFVIDSMDALIRNDDRAKKYTEANKVAGNALLSKTFFKTISLNISAGCHFLGIISQIITNINTSGYGGSKTVPSGGKGIAYFSSTILEVKPTWTETIFWENPNGSSIKDKGKRLGHYFQAEIKKHVNDEQVGRVINVPIKHGAPPGEAVWKEREFLDLCIEWGKIKNEGKGNYKFSESFIKELAEKGIECKEGVKGESNLVDYLTENPTMVKEGLEMFKHLLFKH